MLRGDVIQDLWCGLPGVWGMSVGDMRVDQRAEWLIERVSATGSLVLRRLGERRAGGMAVYRFLSSRYVSVDRFVAALAGRTAAACVERRVLLVQDTTEINFSGRDGKRRGFGPAGDGETSGYFIHPVIAVDVESEAVVGLVDAAIWTRAEGQAGRRRSRVLEAKESARWLAACQSAARSLSGASALTMVADREGDIYPLFARKPAGLELIVRAAQNRNLAGGGQLFDVLAAAGCSGTT